MTTTARRARGRARALARARARGRPRRRAASRRSPTCCRACARAWRRVRRVRREPRSARDRVAASLTELFAGDIMEPADRRVRAALSVGRRGRPAIACSRTVQALTDARYGLAFVLERAPRKRIRTAAPRALERKCEILWGLLDAIERAHAAPRLCARRAGAARRSGAARRAARARGEALGQRARDPRARRREAHGDRDRHARCASAIRRSSGIADDVHDFLDRDGAARRARARTRASDRTASCTT